MKFILAILDRILIFNSTVNLAVFMLFWLAVWLLAGLAIEGMIYVIRSHYARKRIYRRNRRVL